MTVSAAAAEYKRSLGLPTRDAAREEEILSAAEAAAAENSRLSREKDAEAVRQLKVPARIRIKQHGSPVLRETKGSDMFQAVLLCFVQVAEQSARRAGGFPVIVEAKRCQLGQMELFADPFRRISELEPGSGLHTADKLISGCGAECILIIAQNFHRTDTGNLGIQCGIVRFQHVKLSG